MNNDFILVDDGSVTFKTFWEITKPPADPALMKDWPKDDGALGEGAKQAGGE